MWTIYTDCPITRRYRMHHVFDETNTLRWSGPLVGNAVHYCLDHGQEKARLEDGEHVWIAHFVSVTN